MQLLPFVNRFTGDKMSVGSARKVLAAEPGAGMPSCRDVHDQAMVVRKERASKELTELKIAAERLTKRAAAKGRLETGFDNYTHHHVLPETRELFRQWLVSLGYEQELRRVDSCSCQMHYVWKWHRPAVRACF
jgi:hypothetical protein